MKKIVLIGLIGMGSMNSICSTATAERLYQEAIQLCEQKNITEALKKLHEVVAVDPIHIFANFRLGFYEQVAEHYQEAANYYHQASLSPETNYNHGVLYSNWGACLTKLGELSSAREALEKTITYQADNSLTHKNLGELYLLLSDFDRGWCEMEKCWGADWQTRKSILQATDLTGVTVLIHDGDGYGDTFNWLRFAKLLKSRHATIYVKARPSLIPLFQQCDYIDKIIPSNQPLPTCTVEVGFLQLTPVLCKTITDIPSDVPYININPEREAYWHEQLSNDHAFKIGICWECKTYIESATRQALEKTRALPLMQFYSISKFNDISLYSLQFCDGLNQLKDIPSDFTLHLFGPDFDKTHGRFIDTTAVIEELDLIITVDTSIAHLAGARGRRVWVLLPYVADWRWFRDRSDSPWYPSMRLFRQKALGDWDGVMREVETALQELIEQKK